MFWLVFPKFPRQFVSAVEKKSIKLVVQATDRTRCRTARLVVLLGSLSNLGETKHTRLCKNKVGSFCSLVVAISTWRHQDLGSNPGRNPCENGGLEFKARVGKLCPLLAFAIRTLLGTYPSTNALRTKFSDRPDVTFRLRIIATVPCESIGGHSRTTGNKSPSRLFAYKRGKLKTIRP